MHVRNLLIIGPILAILAARGIADACDSAGERLAPVGVAASVVVLIVINGGWLVYAGETIRAERSQFIGELAAYTDARPESYFFISPMLCEELAQIPGGKRFNYSCDPQVPADAYVYLTPEVTRSGGQNIVPSNRRNLNLAMFGPHEVNLDYYSSWPTNRHIRISDREGAKDMGFPFVVDYKERARQKHKAQKAALERHRRQQSRRARPGQGQ